MSLDDLATLSTCASNTETEQPMGFTTTTHVSEADPMVWAQDHVRLPIATDILSIREMSANEIGRETFVGH
jgi:hypothetical protein